MASCLFCKILAGEMAAKIVYQDESCIAFQDINPQAPVHLLLIPRKHVASAEEAEEADEPVLGHLHRVAAQLAQQHGLAGQGSQDGYRTVVNTGSGAGQSVFHLHMHLLGGRPLRWPPG